MLDDLRLLKSRVLDALSNFVAKLDNSALDESKTYHSSDDTFAFNVYFQEWKNRLSKRFSFNRKAQAALLNAYAKPMSVGRKPVEIAKHMVRYGNSVQRRISKDIINELRDGRGMTDALDGWVDPISLSALRAAEQGGADTLIQAMAFIASNLEKNQKAKAAVYLKCAYPGLFVGITIFMIVFLEDKIVPLFRSVVGGQPHDLLDKFSATSAFYTNWFWLVILVTIITILYIKHLLRTYIGPGRDVFDSISFFSSYRLSVGASVVSTYALLKRFGISGYQILKIMASNGSPYQQYHIFQMRERLKEGGDNEVDSLDTGLLDDQYISLLKLYTEADDVNVVAAMASAADDIEQRVLVRTSVFGTVISYALWFWLVLNITTIISLVVGFNP